MTLPCLSLLFYYWKMVWEVMKTELVAICIIVMSVFSYLPTEEVCHIARISGTRWVVAHEAAVPTAEAAFQQLPPGTLRQLWVLGDALNHRPSLGDLMRTQPPGADQLNQVKTSSSFSMSKRNCNW